MTDNNSFTDLNGLDEHSCKSWIYPTNFPIRNYQYNIAETSLFNNTLVSLPTGLGKTMIAAVVMYNIYRWYPTGRVIFMAPTRPLVTQQKEACRQITGLPTEHIAELTGEIRSKNRTEVWNQARVLFVTPQVLMFDLVSKVCPKHLIRCLVIDEAHRARGNHAYCEVIKHLGDDLAHIRILALSATPGSSPNQVVEVVRALNISRLEVRTEASPDVREYVFERKIETVIVPFCDMLKSVIEEYIKILDQYTRRLIKCGVFTGSARNLHKGRIFMVQKQYKQNCQQQGKAPEPIILQDLNFCLTLYHAYDVLIKHGFRGFISFYNDHQDKGWIQKNLLLSQLLERIQKYIGVTPLDIEMLPDGTIPEVSRDIVLGHPKFKILRDIVEKQLKNEPESRVIVFFEYRESVLEAYNALLSCRPVVRPRMFLGQSSITQRQQLFVMTKFRSGECNTLLCTSVGEEGLDIAAVELIVCFDISNKSPVRLIQRMGRTGRHSTGKVVMLVTEGREQQTLKECLQLSETLDKCLLNSPELKASLLVALNPNLLPPEIKPVCHKMFMTVAENKPADKKKNTVIDRSRKRQTNKWAPCTKSNSFRRYNIPLQIRQMNWDQDINENLTSIKIDVEDNQSDGEIQSNNRRLLVDLKNTAQDLEFNLYSPKRKKKREEKPTKKKMANKDIRIMFQKTTSITETNEVTKTDEQSNILLNLITEVNTKKSIESLQDKKCNMCANQFNCEEIAPFLEGQQNITIPNCPSESTFQSITNDNLLLLNIQELPRFNNDVFDFTQFSQILSLSKVEQEVQNLTTDNFMNNNTLNNTNQEDTKLMFTEQDNMDNETRDTTSVLKVAVINKKCTDKCNFTEYVLDKESQETLRFFGLDSIESLFDGSDPCHPFGFSEKYRKLQNEKLLQHRLIDLEKSPVLSNRKTSRLKKKKIELLKQNRAKQTCISKADLNITPITELDSAREETKPSTSATNTHVSKTGIIATDFCNNETNFSYEDIFVCQDPEDTDAEFTRSPEFSNSILHNSPVLFKTSYRESLLKSPVLSNTKRSGSKEHKPSTSKSIDYCNKTAETSDKGTQINDYLAYFSDEDLFGPEDNAIAEVIEIDDSPTKENKEVDETITKNKRSFVRRKKTKRTKNPFLCTQAEVDSSCSDEMIYTDSDENENCSFITQVSDESSHSVDMQAVYLQSVKNSTEQGKFKIPQLPQMKISEIYSQDVTANDSYLLDSFCVDNNSDFEDSPPKTKKFTRIISLDSSNSD